jgi:transcriptional regulator with GAF, ATPase, and Fis domain
MAVKLVALSGPRKGDTFTIPSGEMHIIGRDSDWLLLSDPSVSRRHCAIRMDEKNCVLLDLDSRNGTSVNGIPIRERVLKHGDQIEVGNSMFLFFSDEELNEDVAIQSEIVDSHAAIRSTIRARLEDVLYLKPEKFQASVLPPTKMARSLQALLKIGRMITSTRTFRNLQNELLEIVFEIVPAQRAAVLLVDQSLKNFSSVFALDQDKKIVEQVEVNRDFVMEVLEGDAAVLSNKIDNTQTQVLAQTSILCAPLRSSGASIGVLYLETNDAAVRFDEDHLHLISTIAGFVGVALENCKYVEELKNENNRLREDLAIQHSMVGESAAMRNVLEFVARVAPTDSTVLITGETGSGKELAARAIHQNSKRGDSPFVTINCATLSETLLESELFGHEKGAFTGAVVQKKGKFEIANAGTIFLDEVAEISPSLQAKLLRVLQERQFERVGGTVPINVNIRIIAATNKNLLEAVQEKLFRQDLFYRLNVLQLKMPSLRERVEDIPLLAMHFASKYAAKMGKKVLGFSPEARRCLVCYSWPGNVRELENAVERALVLGNANFILPEDLPELIIESQPPDVQLSSYQEAIKEAKRRIILKAMEQANSNYAETARILEIHPNNLHRLIRDLNLKSTLKPTDPNKD